jgi:hypothetical protein
MACLFTVTVKDIPKSFTTRSEALTQTGKENDKDVNDY